MKTRSYLKNILVISIVTCFLIEVSLRFLPFFIPEPYKSMFSEARCRTFNNLRVFLKPGEGDKVFSVFRILLPEKEKKGIIVLGNSFAFGWNVKQFEAFPNIIQSISGIEVANLGVGATGPPHYNRMLEVGMQYNPELIMYCIFLDDFIYSNNIRKLSMDNVYARYDSDNLLFIDKPDAAHRLNLALKHITNMFLSIQIIKYYRWIRRNKLFEHSGNTPISVNYNGHCFYLLKKEFITPYRELADLDKTIGFVKEAHSFAKKNRKEFLVILIPSKEMVYGPLTKQRDMICGEYFMSVFNKFKENLEDNDISCFNSVGYLSEKAKAGKKLYFTLDGHFNKTGHKEMALAIIRYLNSRKYWNIDISQFH